MTGDQRDALLSVGHPFHMSLSSLLFLTQSFPVVAVIHCVPRTSVDFKYVYDTFGAESIGINRYKFNLH